MVKVDVREDAGNAEHADEVEVNEVEVGQHLRDHRHAIETTRGFGWLQDERV